MRSEPPAIAVKYGDPPYLGCCSLYGHAHPEGVRPFDGRCWDDPATHEALIGWMDQDCDGWALSATSGSLRTLLPMCPDDVRVGAWVKPFHAYKKGVRPAYSWEPIIFRGGRQEATYPPKGQPATTPKDHIAANITLRKGFTGAKPDAVSVWLFDLMGLRRGDTFIDVFPGSGAVGDCWDRFVAADRFDQLTLGAVS